MTVQEIIAETVSILHRRLPEGDCKIYLFGSHAKGATGPASDIDIGLLGAGPLNDLTLFRLRDEVKAIATLRRIEKRGTAQGWDRRRLSGRFHFPDFQKVLQIFHVLRAAGGFFHFNEAVK